MHLAIFFFLPITLTKIHHCCRLLFFWNLYDSRQCRRFHSFHASKNAKYLSIRNNSPLFLSSIDSSFLFYSPMGFSTFLPVKYTVHNHMMSTQYSWDIWESKKIGAEKRDSKTAILSKIQKTKLGQAEEWGTLNYINLKLE